MKTLRLIMVSSIMLLFIAVNLKAQAPCLISPLAVTMEDGETQVFTAPNGQAYFWTITSGPGVIVGGNTSQSVIIEATGTGTILLSVAVFANGTCFDCHTNIPVVESTCPVEIHELITMRYGTSCHCWEKRGHYVAKDCNGDLVAGDWDIVPNGNSGSCIYSGCTTPFDSRVLNTVSIKPHPTCNWVGMNTTIYFYAQNTNTLLTSKTVTIGQCKGKSPKRVATPDKVLKVLNNHPGGNVSFEINTMDLIDLSIECIAISSGKSEVLYSSELIEEGMINLDFPHAKFEKGMYLIVVKSGDKIVAKEKILNL